VERIREREERTRLLAGKKVRLVFKDTPVIDAVAQLKKQTGYDVQLDGDQGGLHDRKITLDTGETTFWKALEQFCRKAGIAEQRPPSSKEYYLQSGELVLFDDQGRVQRMSRSLRALVGERLLDVRVVLTDRKAEKLPTHHAGAVRIQALPALKPTLTKDKSEKLRIDLEVLPEPALVWLGVSSLQIVRAIDDKGQLLKQPEPYRNLEEVLTESEMFKKEVEREAGDPVGGPQVLRSVPVYLTSGKHPSKLLKELSGTVTARVMASKTLVEVDH